MYGKLFASIFDGSLYGNFEGTVTMMALIALADSAGHVDMTSQALAARTGYPIEVILKGLNLLASPDEHSRSKECEGRRIVPIDPDRGWGWALVNHAKYRRIRSEEDRREYMREYMHKQRLAKLTPCKHPLAMLAKTEAEVEAETEVKERGARATRFACSQMPPEWSDYCKAKRPDLDAASVFENFADFWKAKAGKDGRKNDWFATWRTWVRNEKSAPRGKQEVLEAKNKAAIQAWVNDAS